MDRFMFMKKMTPGSCLPLPRAYINVYDHNIPRILLHCLCKDIFESMFYVPTQ